MTMECKSITQRVGTCLFVVFLTCLVGINHPASAQAKSANAAPAQTGFETAQLASAALIEAAEKFDVDSLRAILGPDSEDLIASEDPVKDKARMIDFAKMAKEKETVELAKNKPQVTLFVGPNDWPLPIPIVNRGGKWYFDTKQGRKEILARRIGANELDAIAVCRGFVEAQEEYAEEIHDDSGVNQYAQRIISTPGKRDGLYWKNADGTAGGPITEAIAKALEEGYSTDNQAPAPFHGYYFKVLKGRGPSAPNGEIDFVIEGAMIGGFALAATPAQYGVTGIKTFIVSYEGIVYQKDLGPDSLQVFSQIERYNPDKTWARTDDHWPDEVVASAQ
jgi:Protein of unknown function (DUF2950)